MPDPDTVGTDQATPLLPGRCQVWALVSLCLGYPDDALVSARDQLAAAAHALPDGPAREALCQFTNWFAAVPASAVTVTYVRTFDMRRDTSLNLTYHSHGETRRRGLALLELKRRLRACGMVPEDGELPDHLPLLLEVAAVEPEAGADLLRLVRPGIEMLHRGLDGSPYSHLLDGLLITLGPADTSTSHVVDELVVLGPPVEEVGTDPCPVPSGDPLVHEARPRYGPLLTLTPTLGCEPEFRSAPGGIR
ncbi:MAG: nitrate reductase molybdenum cofactor assembly chaperone [Micrococcales bacterium]|nr:nitrate reductase molybdenum cofactor assembly chaperone [Micrococcales bacterium]MCL2667442.1 nitrate reductase molybdenum cofactor assembly chaperone [Micrococcales bacterium]